MRPVADLKTPATQRSFRSQLLSWYQANRRSLPWRKTKDPYRIWVSEIMLQQTRVAAVLEHFRKFLNRFPTVSSLAGASEADVLTQWSGLGYYRRARMLHCAAKVVHAECRGSVPNSALRLRELPGIGRYTANAIASIAFGEPVAVIDGNVERVLARVNGKTLKGEDLWNVAELLLDPRQPGDFNQAMMELGATVCVPGTPLCGHCPVKTFCASRGLERAKKPVPEQRQKRSASLLLVQRGQRILLQQRSHRERLMPGMWELPQSSRQLRRKPVITVKHSITVTDWTVSVFRKSSLDPSAEMEWIALDRLSSLPLTGVTRKILMNLKLLAWNRSMSGIDTH
jgi:A/G-specific adenine glycosylase